MKISLRSSSTSYRDEQEFLSVNKLLRSHRHINNNECKPLKVASCRVFFERKKAFLKLKFALIPKE